MNSQIFVFIFPTLKISDLFPEILEAKEGQNFASFDASLDDNGKVTLHIVEKVEKSSGSENEKGATKKGDIKVKNKDKT